MSCEHWLPMLLRAAEDGLDALGITEQDGLTAHLAECIECRRALVDQRAVREVLSMRTDADVPPGLAARVVNQEHVWPGWVNVLRWRTWSFRLAPLAAGLLLFGVANTRSASAPEQIVGLSELTESWAFGAQAEEGRPTFTLLGGDDVGGDLLLDAILGAEPDEPLSAGDSS